MFTRTALLLGWSIVLLGVTAARPALAQYNGLTSVKFVHPPETYGTIVGLTEEHLHIVRVATQEAVKGGDLPMTTDIVLPKNGGIRRATLLMKFSATPDHVVALYRITVNGYERADLHRFSTAAPTPDEKLSMVFDTYSGQDGFEPKPRQWLSYVSTSNVLSLIADDDRRWYSGIPVHDASGKLLGVIADRWTRDDNRVKAIPIGKIRSELEAFSKGSTSAKYDQCAYFDLSDRDDGLSECQFLADLDEKARLALLREKESRASMTRRERKAERLERNQTLTAGASLEGAWGDRWRSWYGGFDVYLFPDFPLHLHGRVQFGQETGLLAKSDSTYMQGQGIRSAKVKSDRLEIMGGAQIVFTNGLYMGALFGIGEQEPSTLHYELVGSKGSVELPDSRWRYPFRQFEAGLCGGRARFGIFVRQVRTSTPGFYQYTLEPGPAPVKPLELLDREAVQVGFHVSYRLVGVWTSSAKESAASRLD